MRFALIVFALFWICAKPSAADIHVVVNANNSVAELNKKDVVAIFTGRTRSFPGGEFAVPLDRDADSEIRATFYRLLTNRSLAQISAYWAKLNFTGRMKPPKEMDDATQLRDYIKNNERAIGYVRGEDLTEEMKVVFTLLE